MKLSYHTGKNLGDALNPYIFKRFLPEGFFDENEDIQFLGIGTILGLKKQKGKKIVFSSGLSMNQTSTYGEPPKIDQDYDVICVRGPLTANVLKLPMEKAVCDGAYLLRDFYPYKAKKKFDFAYMPHHRSESFSSEFKGICKNLGIEYISPQDDMDVCLKKISQTKIMITEAMHGAIIADAFDIPWVPVKSYPFIDDYKWKDFVLSMEIRDFVFNALPSLHSANFFKDVIKEKTKSLLPDFICFRLAILLEKSRKRSFQKDLDDIRNSNDCYVSSLTIKDEKVKILKALLEGVNKKYNG